MEQSKTRNHRARHKTRASLLSDKGLDAANHNRASGGGRRMFLTSLLIEQAFYHWQFPFADLTRSTVEYKLTLHHGREHGYQSVGPRWARAAGFDFVKWGGKSGIRATASVKLLGGE